MFVSKKDAAHLDIMNGDRLAIRSDAGTVEVHAAVVENMAPGVLVLPRHHRLDWQHLEGFRIRLNKNRIFKMDGDT